MGTCALHHLHGPLQADEHYYCDGSSPVQEVEAAILHLHTAISRVADKVKLTEERIASFESLAGKHLSGNESLTPSAAE
jgi:hypothetical protein